MGDANTYRALKIQLRNNAPKSQKKKTKDNQNTARCKATNWSSVKVERNVRSFCKKQGSLTNNNSD